MGYEAGSAAEKINPGSAGRVVFHTLVILLFFLSGASSLIYEILWMRMFTQVFGSTTAATSTVLAAFMAGLALGSYLIGSYAHRHPQNALKLYAYLEGLIGIFGLLMPFLIQILYVIYGWLALFCGVQNIDIDYKAASVEEPASHIRVPEETLDRFTRETIADVKAHLAEYWNCF